MLRKLQAVKEVATAGAKSPAKTLKASSRLQGILEVAGQEVRMMNELQSQKARSVAQMVLKLLSNSHHCDLQSSRHSRRIRVRRIVRWDVLPRPRPRPSSTDSMRRQRLSVVCTAFDAYSQGLLFRDPSDDPSDDVDAPEERLFIVSWVEYCNKYEMG